MNGIKKLLESQKTLHVLIIVACITFFLNAVAKYYIGQFAGMLCIAIVIPCLIVLLVSYDRHQKNVMKTMIGCLLMWFVMDEIDYIGNVVVPEVVAAGGIYNCYSGKMYMAFDIVIVTGYIIIFINHLVLNADHHSNPKIVTVNRIIAVLSCVLSLIQMYFTWQTIGTDMYNNLEIISWYIAQIAFLLTIVCLESIFDEFKSIRERVAE